MSVFDWCNRSDHTNCKKSFEKWYMGPVGTGRKKKTGVIFTGEFEECECTCHRKGENG